MDNAFLDRLRKLLGGSNVFTKVFGASSLFDCTPNLR